MAAGNQTALEKHPADLIPEIGGERASTSSSQHSLFERIFESLLWNSRLVVLAPVLGSLILGVGMVVVATTDAARVVITISRYPLLHAGSHSRQFGERSDPLEFADVIRTQMVAHIVEVIDGYLLATIMLIFSFGLYELFISRLDVAGGTSLSSRLLTIRSLDDLKDRLAKVVLLILVVKFFEHAVKLSFNSPKDLMQLSVGIILIAGSLYLGHRHPEHTTNT